MKIPVTEQFLWDAYNNVLSKAEDVVDFLISNRYRQIDLLFGNENPVFKKYRKEKGAKKFAKIIYNLKKNNIIKSKNLEHKKAFMLTREGIDKIIKISFKVEKKEKRKDGKWAMLIFDVPEKYKKSRELLRSILQNLGYKMFQQSVWITPYDVSEKTEKLLQYHSLDEFVKIFLIEEI